MAKPKRGANPFYFLLVLVGVALVITASSFWMRAYQEVRPVRGDKAAETAESHPLWDFIDEHGNQLLIVELVVLAVLTVGAIATDEFWASRPRRSSIHSVADSRPSDQIPAGEPFSNEETES